MERLLGAGVAAACLMATNVHADAIVYVDGAARACSDSASGTPADPYCSISAALAAHHDPGTMIVVFPGVYRERVLLPGSGVEGQPLVLQGTPGAVVDGTDDFSDPDLWQPAQGGIWLAPGVTWSPNQVFVDSLRLKHWDGEASAAPPGSFGYVSGVGLFVNIGGDNPGNHLVLVGRRPYGFQMSSRSWVSIRGFTIEHEDLKGIYMTQKSDHIEVTGNTIRLSFRYGVQADTSTAVLVSDNLIVNGGDHGIAFTRGTTSSLVAHNESAFHSMPGTRQANGIYLFRCPANVIRDNRCHDNQDTGVQIQSGSNGNLCLQNMSWNNGDHGFDNLFATGNTYVSNVAWGNYRNGFSFEGFSSGNSLYDSIAAENGLQTNEPDLWLDSNSIVGFQSDYNIIWNSTTQPPIRVGYPRYATVADFTAQYGTDAHTFQLDPMFVAPRFGDFHLLAGSPAIDAADTNVPGWSAIDADGNTRSDDPVARDAGFGPVSFADRGALEYSAAYLASGGGITAYPTKESQPNLVTTIPAPIGLVVRPNPVRLAANFHFRLSRQGRARLLICDPGGRVLRDLLDARELAAGEHDVAWDLTDRAGSPLRAGMYFCTLQAPAGAESGCFALVR
jgi:parallel beta-helix repeat protein